MPPPYPNWTPTTPHTDSHANALTWRSVKHATVIEVSAATYRNSLPIKDRFELVNPTQTPQQKYGALRIEVLCSWFGVKPLTTHPNIIVVGSFKILTNYSGNVVDDIRR